MLREKRLTKELLDGWLQIQPLENGHPRYRLRLWKERREGLNHIRRELIGYMDETFEDARKKMRSGFDLSFSPFNDPSHDPAAHYPDLLHRTTLLGYFGETLSVLAIEHWGAFGFDDWKVPLMLFRMHDVEFRHLDSINERLLLGEAFTPDITSEKRPGRLGDDALAFRIDESSGVITDILTLEAKCLESHHAGKLSEAHEKLNDGRKRPPGVHELISILDEYDTDQARNWKKALLEFWINGYRRANRYDGVCYACAQKPVKTKTWMDPNKPHEAYKIERKLECMEFHFLDSDIFVEAIRKK